MVKRVVQVLQGGGDDPRPSSGTGGNLELSGLEVLSDRRRDRGLRSLSGVDVVRGGGSEAERIRGSRSCDEGEKDMGKAKKGG